MQVYEPSPVCRTVWSPPQVKCPSSPFSPPSTPFYLPALGAFFSTGLGHGADVLMMGKIIKSSGLQVVSWVCLSVTFQKSDE